MPNISKPILPGQTLVDIAMQELGDASRVFELAVLNGMSITEDLEPGANLLIPVAASDKKRLVQMFNMRALAPASADVSGDIISTNSGIDYDTIEADLIIQ